MIDAPDLRGQAVALIRAQAAGRGRDADEVLDTARAGGWLDLLAMELGHLVQVAVLDHHGPLSGWLDRIAGAGSHVCAVIPGNDRERG